MRSNIIIIGRLFCLILICCTLTPVLMAQQDDPVLFTVGDQDVHVSEFTYIYEKNNRNQANYDKKSLEEYLDLYINFKLKVQRARELGLQNSEAYKKELEGYKRQLADSYVIDREVFGVMSDDLFKRKKFDIGLSHILIAVDRNATDAKVKAALQKVDKVKNALEESEFADIAITHSNDLNSAKAGGNIGYITAAMPDGFVELENLAYSLKVGEIGGPVRSDLGFHFIKVNDIRPARGKVEAAHILIRNRKNGIKIAQAKVKADTAFAILKRHPHNWDDMARTLSQDTDTAPKGGNLGVFGISVYDKGFEDVVFSLKNDGEISEPYESNLGYHIIKRIAKIPPESIDDLKILAKSKMNKGERYDIYVNKAVKRLQKESGYVMSNAALQNLKDSIDALFLQYSWTPPELSEEELFRFGNNVTKLSEFTDYCKNQSKIRLQGQKTDVNATVDKLFDKFLQSKAFEYADAHLSDRYLDFRNLLREYEEGILLFEITQREVWDKAGKDEEGLTTFFHQNEDQYVWEPRAEITMYTVKTTNGQTLEKLMKAAQNFHYNAVMEPYKDKKNPILLAENLIVERSSDKVRGMPFKANVISKLDINNEFKVSKFTKIERTIPAGKKTLDESRGYVISDYQDHLEKLWIDALKKKFDVSIKKKVFRKLIR